MDESVQESGLTPEREAQLRGFAARLGISPRNLSLYEQAFTHASRVAEAQGGGGDYESLEFLGDAVLGLAAAHHFVDKVPGKTPGEYSRMRAGMVNRETVARVAEALDIAPLILLGRGEEISGGRQRVSLLADCLEALIGAVYLDRGWRTAEALVKRAFRRELARAGADGEARDCKSRLQEFCQAAGLGLPRFEVVSAEGPDHCKEFEVEVVVDGRAAGRGCGRSKKEAAQRAAREALRAAGAEPA